MSRNRLVLSPGLFAAVAFGLSFAANAGPLEPPAGPVASTYKTLNEVQPRIPINATNTPGDADSVFKITQRGSYYLTGNVTGAGGKSGIEITVSGVSIDLNGFDLLGVAGSLDAVRVESAGFIYGVSVSNGGVRGWGGDGVDLSATGVRGGSVANVKSTLNAGRGIVLRSGLIESCTASNNAQQGIVIVSGTIKSSHATSNSLTGILGDGPGCTIIGCTSTNNETYGIFVNEDSVVADCVSTSNTGHGIGVGNGAIARNSVSSQNGLSGFQLLVGGSAVGNTARANVNHGILAVGNATVRDNFCTGNGANGVGSGIYLQGSDCRVEGNRCSANDIGIEAAGSSNVIIRNSCSANGMNWDLAANNLYAPIVNRSAAVTGAVAGDFAVADATAAQHPHANYTH